MSILLYVFMGELWSLFLVMATATSLALWSFARMTAFFNPLSEAFSALSDGCNKAALSGWWCHGCSYRWVQASWMDLVQQTLL